MTLNVLVLNAHPRAGSFIDAVTDRYAAAAESAGAQVTVVNVRDLTFDPTMCGGYAAPDALEPDLLNLQRQLAACDHLAVTTPLWWNGVPAPLKGLVDRTLLPGFAFKYIEGKPMPRRLLTGRSARILISMDSPTVYQLMYAGDTAVRMLKRNTLAFCGFKPIRVTRFTSMRESTPEKREAYLRRAADAGTKDGSRQVTDAERAARTDVQLSGV